jgi:hypothetical protein
MSKTSKVKLHARPGLAALHIDDAVHAVAPDGTVEVPPEHVEAALTVGCSRAPTVVAAPHADRMADLEARVAVLEAEWAEAKGADADAPARKTKTRA